MFTKKIHTENTNYIPPCTLYKPLCLCGLKRVNHNDHKENTHGEHKLKYSLLCATLCVFVVKKESTTMITKKIHTENKT